MSDKATIKLPLSEKYTQDHAFDYYVKHKASISRRLSHWREANVARKALKAAGNPNSVLDLPCGAGRFWSLLAEHPERILYAAENSPAMLEVAKQKQAADIVERIKLFQTSAFAIEMEDNAVECIFCMRLMHHIADHSHRLALLNEFNRVTKDTVILSLWVDGNYKAWRRGRLEARRSFNPHNRFVVPRVAIEAEFEMAGFEVVSYYDFMPKYAMWRTYVLAKK